MISVAFSFSDDRIVRYTGSPGDSVMEIAVRNDVPGIIGECGGQLSCATCHVYLLGGTAAPVSDDELEMLELVSARRDDSRLGCQIILPVQAIDLIVGVPPLT